MLMILVIMMILVIVLKPLKLLQLLLSSQANDLLARHLQELEIFTDRL